MMTRSTSSTATTPPAMRNTWLQGSGSLGSAVVVNRVT